MVLGLAGGIIPGVDEMLNSFATIEHIKGINQKNIITLRLKAQPTLLQMAEQGAGPAWFLVNGLPNNQELYFAIKSKNTFTDILKNNLTLLKALKGFEIDLQVNVIRDFFPTLFQAMRASEHSAKDVLLLTTILTAPTDLNLNLKMDIENVIPKEVQSKVDLPLSMLHGMMMPFIDQFLGPDSLVHKVNGINITVNAVGVYLNVDLHLPGLLKK